MSTKPRIETDYSGKKQVVVYTTTSLDEPARLAGVLIEKWALVAAAPDGEDSAGRAKARLLTPEELVDRAIAVSERFYEVMRARGHLVDLPDLNEINEAYDDAKHETKDSKRAAETLREKLGALGDKLEGTA